MQAEPVSAVTPRPVRRAILLQEWRDLTFLHWPADPGRVADLLPPGIRPDTFDGITYVGLVPFQMHRVRLPYGPGVPYLGTFNETNVRLYTVDTEGRRGVAFCSMDAARLLPAVVGRIGARLPYIWSTMQLARDGDIITYTCRRRLRVSRGKGAGHPLAYGTIASRAVVEIDRPIAQPTAFEHFLTARWGLHVRWYGRTLYLPNEHPEWPLYQARLLDLDDDLIAAGGRRQPSDPPVSVLYSPGVPVRFGAPRAVA